MVEPSAFADTVTPAIFSPVEEVMVPRRPTSANARQGSTRLVVSKARMELLLLDGLEVGHDRLDLGRREVVAEPRHLLRAAVGDEGAQRGVVAAERGARERRRVLRARHLRLGVTDAAGLVEEPLPEKPALGQG